MRRGLLGICAVVVGAAWTLVAAHPAASQAVPTVTVSHGPTILVLVSRDCSDVAQDVHVHNRFILQRDVDNGADVVHYEVSGRAVVGVDYVPLPGEAVIPAGIKEVAVPIEALTTTGQDHVETVTVTLTSGSSYVVGEPSSTTIRFLVHRDPALPPVDCNPGFQITDAPTNTEQTIEVGDVPIPIETVGGEGIPEVTSGELPPGVSIAPESPFAFVGGATTIGTFTADLEVCPTRRNFGGWTCRTTTLTVHVVPQVEGLARTGSWVGYESVLGVALIALGVALRRRSSAM